MCLFPAKGQVGKEFTREFPPLPSRTRPQNMTAYAKIETAPISRRRIARILKMPEIAREMELHCFSAFAEDQARRRSLPSAVSVGEGRGGVSLHLGQDLPIDVPINKTDVATHR